MQESPDLNSCLSESNNLKECLTINYPNSLENQVQNTTDRRTRNIIEHFILFLQKRILFYYLNLLNSNRTIFKNQMNSKQEKSFSFLNNQPKSKLLFIILISFLCICNTNGCELWKAADCTGSPTAAEEELMKSDDYSKEELYKYCDKGKAYVDCVNAKLKCCDLKPELRGALAAYDKQLEKQAWKLGPYCSGIGEANVIYYKCRTTTRRTSTTTGKSTKPTLPPCQIEKAGEDCSHFLDGRVKFEESWNVYDKMQWCRDTIDYVNCASQYLLNCNISTLRNEADQLQSFIDFVTKSSNVHCPGGIKGCENSTNDVRCRLGLRYFMGELTNTNNAQKKLIVSFKLISLILNLFLIFFHFDSLNITF